MQFLHSEATTQEALFFLFIAAVCAGIGVCGSYLFVAALEWERPPDASIIAILAGLGGSSAAFMWIGARLAWSAFRVLFALGSSPLWESVDRPWLRNPQWRKRAIPQVHGMGTPVLLLVASFFGVMVLGFFGMRLSLSPGETAFDERLAMLIMGGLFASVIGAVACYWLRGRRHGGSVCRLLTLPGVVGGWFKADVECALPAGPQPVVVRLKNFVQARDSFMEVWALEQSLYDVPAASAGRSVVRVRLRVPRDSSQRCPPVKGRSGDEFSARATWLLEIEKEVPGIDFFAAFPVPIYDTPNAPPAEQRDESDSR
jgi:hypothetical protein